MLDFSFEEACPKNIICFRRMFGLDKVSKMTDGFMYLPGLASAGAPAYAAHSLYVRDDIVLQVQHISSSTLFLFIRPNVFDHFKIILHRPKRSQNLILSK